jgi:hypothetical protein
MQPSCLLGQERQRSKNFWHPLQHIPQALKPGQHVFDKMATHVLTLASLYQVQPASEIR